MHAAPTDIAPVRVPAWVEQLFSSIDAQNAQQFAEYFTDSGVFYFANAPGVQGRSAIVDAVGEFFASIGNLQHKITLVVSQPEVVVCCGEVTYTRHDGTQLSLPFADTFLTNNEKIQEYRIYMDIGPLYS